MRYSANVLQLKNQSRMSRRKVAHRREKNNNNNTRRFAVCEKVIFTPKSSLLCLIRFYCPPLFYYRDYNCFVFFFLFNWFSVKIHDWP